MCRKAHGAPYATYTSCTEEELTWTGNLDLIAEYPSSEDVTRRFCRTCGGSLPGSVTSNGRMFLPMGSHENGAGFSGGHHLFVGSNAPWLPITDDLPQHETYPAAPGIHSDLRVYEGPAPSVAPGEGIRGSCLCGTVTYTVKPPFKEIHNCHCERCRHTRGAAHTTNGFVPADAVTFQSGLDHVVRYKLPEAVRFAVTFCDICGGGVARVDADRGIASIPMGALDDDPGQGADDHIYVAYKADRWEIAGDLPQFQKFTG